MEEEIPRNYSIAQKRALFFRFVEFNDPHFNDELKAKVHTTMSLKLITQTVRAGKSIHDYMPEGPEMIKFCKPSFGIDIQAMLGGVIHSFTNHTGLGLIKSAEEKNNTYLSKHANLKL